MIELNVDLQLESITIDQQAQLNALMQRIYPPAYDYFWTDNGAWYLQYCYGLKGLQQDLTMEDSRYYFIRSNSTIVGVFLLRLKHNCPDFPTCSALKIQKLYLGKEAQGKGIAQQLMQYAEQLALELGKDMCWLECMDTKEQALRFYHKLGYLRGSRQTLDFERLLPSVRGMFIMHKKLR